VRDVLDETYDDNRYAARTTTHARTHARFRR